MQRLAIVVTSLLLASASLATELVRVRVSQFEGSEPAALSSASHPELFVLDPSIALAELVATNPADPRKENHGPAAWLPELTPRQGPALEHGSIELRITPLAGQPVALGALHFRSAALVPGRPAGFSLAGTGLEAPRILPGSRRRDFDQNFTLGSPLSLERATTVTLLLAAAPSDQPASFRWSAGASSIGTAGGPAGFRDVDVVVTTPLCAAAPRADCVAATHARQTLRERKLTQRLAWRWRVEGAGFEPLGGADAAPLFAWCVYQAGAPRLQALFGPDVCGAASCWTDRPHRFRYRADGDRLALRATPHGVAGALAVSFPAYGGRALLSGELRSQLVRSDDGACFESTLALP